MSLIAGTPKLSFALHSICDGAKRAFSILSFKRDGNFYHTELPFDMGFFTFKSSGCVVYDTPEGLVF